jgi:hypothetical protein
LARKIAPHPTNQSLNRLHASAIRASTAIASASSLIAPIVVNCLPFFDFHAFHDERCGRVGHRHGIQREFGGDDPWSSDRVYPDAPYRDRGERAGVSTQPVRTIKEIGGIG